MTEAILIIVILACIGAIYYVYTRGRVEATPEDDAESVAYKVESQQMDTDFYTGFTRPLEEVKVQKDDYLSKIAFAEGEYEAAITAADVEPKIEALADYIAEVSVQESVQVEETPVVEEAQVKKKRKYTRKPKAATGEQ
jgi:hypothetical protein